MTPYEHLAVLISIVLGLGVAHLLTNVHRLARARARVTLYWLPLLWVGLLLVTQVEWWWASYGLRREASWNFFYFFFVLLSPIALYLAAAFALPELEGDGPWDLREYYYATRGWFFPLVALGPALDAIRRGVQSHTWASFEVGSNVAGAVLVGSLAVARRPAYHAAVTLAVTGLLLYVIVSSALELR